MMSQYSTQNEFDEITVRLVPALPHWFHFLRTPHYCNVQSQGHPHCHFLPQNHKVGGYPTFKVHLEGPCRFFFFSGRGHNYLLYLLMDSSSPPPGINNERSVIRIPFTVQHLTKCLRFRLKDNYKLSVVTIFF